MHNFEIFLDLVLEVLKPQSPALTVRTRLTLCFQSCLLPILNIPAVSLLYAMAQSQIFQNGLLTLKRHIHPPMEFQKERLHEDHSVAILFLMPVTDSP